MVLLLRDGTWIPGVRVESASFSLSLPAVVNAYTTAVAAQRQHNVVAAVCSRPFRAEEDLYLAGLPDVSWTNLAPDVRMCAPPDALPASVDAAPESPRWTGTVASPDDGVAAAREIADAAYVPASSFPVGALLELGDGSHVPGVNVEHPDWTRTLCAERCALGTACAYGLPLVDAARLYLTCARDPEGTPCGACRQWIAELTPEATLWMDRHSQEPASATIASLLPGSFRGRVLLS